MVKDLRLTLQYPELVRII